MPRRWLTAAAVVVGVVGAAAAFLISRRADEINNRVIPEVAFVKTHQGVQDEMVELAAAKPGDVVYDLGCGDGRLVIAVVSKTPDTRGVGIDIDPDRVADATAAVKAAGLADRIQVREQDVRQTDLRNVNVVVAYLFAKLQGELIPNFQQMPPGSRIVCHQHVIPGIKYAEKRIVTGDQGEPHLVYLYVTPLVSSPDEGNSKSEAPNPKQDPATGRNE